MRIAFLGLGKMGRLMAGRLLDDGHDLTVWNRSGGKGTELVARGAREAETPRAAAKGAEVVVLMLFDGPAVRSVLLEGPDCVTAGLSPDALILDASTSGPIHSRAIAATLAETGIRYVDAPVVGSTPLADKGQLGVLLGGSGDDVALARRVVAAWGDPGKIWVAGDVGAGQALKLVVNLSLGLTIAGVRECLSLAESAGLELGTVLGALGVGPFGGILGQKHGHIESGTFTPANFTVEGLAKDLRMAVALGADGPGATGALAAAAQVEAAGHGGDDFSAVAVIGR